MKKWILLTVCLTFNSVLSLAASSTWKITQPVWTEQHEQLFGEFVSRIANFVENRKCNTVSNCLQSPANVYFGSDPKGLRYYADCADFPYYLRAYFAWKNGLPFSYQDALKPQASTDRNASSDIRYSPEGNLVLSRNDIIAKESRFFGGTSYPDAVEILNETFSNFISTASYRMSGLIQKPFFSDFYPVRIDRNGVRPGTVIYDTNGHVAIVYKVSQEGRIFYIDAHPDNSVTTGMFTSKFARSRPDQGAGFKNFRPLILTGARQNDQGAFIGGHIIGVENNLLPLFGIEQFYGTKFNTAGWNKGTFIINDQTVDFYEYVRLSLTTGNQQLNPLDDLKFLINDICANLKDRVSAVEAAKTSGVSYKPHPTILPSNIYGTDGEWEAYATPSRDARLKIAFVELLKQAKSSLEKYSLKDPSISYQGDNLAKDLFKVYTTEAVACQFSYNTSIGKKVLLNLESARQRLFNMSFDPYHCIELRWGARIPEEIASCTDGQNKKLWYQREQWLRNQTDRNYDVRTNFGIDELTGPLQGGGATTPPDIDIVNYLRSQM